ncbi:MAG: peptidylprolyl isomerase [Paracoccaceae bacterium]|nr:peptidylprolyl isomerase [Paracoccaceae bacterium]
MPLSRAFLAALLASSFLASPLALSAEETTNEETAATEETTSEVEAPAPADPDLVVATVNGEEITLGDLILLRVTLDPQRVNSIPPEQLYDNLVVQATNKTLLRQAAVRAEMQDRKTVAKWLAFQRDGILSDVYASERVSELLNEDLLASEYQKRFVEADRPMEWSANHILVQDEAEAQRLSELARADGADFEQLAKDNSKGPSAPQGGSLGWFRQGQLVPEFQATVETLEAGGVSDPVQTQFGWHVIRLNETREAPPPAMGQVQRELVELLTAQITESVVNALRDSGEVTVVDGQPGIDDLANITLITDDE